MPGEPPVPITVWHVPAAPPAEPMSRPLATRVVHNFTHPADLIVDWSDGTQLSRAIIAAGRRTLAPPDGPAYPAGAAALLVVTWPVDDPTPTGFFVRARALLRHGGCVAVVLPHVDPTVQGDIIAAGRDAGLAYLQHVVAVTATSRGDRSTGRARLRVHTDILVLTRPRTGAGRDG